MRIRWNDTVVQEHSEVDFQEAHMYDEEGELLSSNIAFNVDGENVGEINIKAFNSLENALAWAQDVCDQLMMSGYFDLRVAGDKVIIFE